MDVPTINLPAMYSINVDDKDVEAVLNSITVKALSEIKKKIGA